MTTGDSAGQSGWLARLHVESPSRIGTGSDLQPVLSALVDAFLTLGLGEVLATTDLDAEKSRCVDALLHTIRELLGLLGNILDFSELDAGSAASQQVPLRPSRIAAEMLDDRRAEARSRELELTLVCDPAMPARVLGDPARLRQIWTILNGNAVKFTRRGSVRVNIGVDATADGRPLLRGVVSDTGADIPLEEQAALFESFTQVDGSLRRRFGGLGLGLAICRLIVARMGGTLGVDSRVGQGARFFFSIPAPICDGVEVATESRWADAAGVGDVSASRAPVVDDNPVNLLLTERQLRTLGVTSPRLAAHGLEALDILTDLTPDLVLMDIQMPDIDGREVIRQLRKLALVRQPWVCAMTANVSDDDRRTCASAGMNDFLPKPVSLSTLCTAMQKAVSAVDLAASLTPN